MNTRFLCLFSVSAFPQGPLTPSGASTPTMKTLQQIQRRTDLRTTPAPPKGDSDA